MPEPTIPAPLDMATHQYLSGVFAPTNEEHDDRDLAVEGELPAGLAGAYLRNGPNVLFPPLGSYTYPLEGDGMVHGIWFEDGRVRYRNRTVWTPQLRAEVAAGHAIWAGITTPYIPGPDVAPPELANDFKPLPDINVIRHGGRHLALAEVDPPVEITAELETVGAYDFGGQIPGMCAHPRIDPLTGELFLFRYNIEEPFLTWSVVGADGTVTTPPQAVDTNGRAFMIHDFTITASSIVLFVGPLEFDFEAMFSGGGLLAWKPDLGMQIAVISRATGDVRWVRTDPFWVWHFANAFDRTTATGATEIVVDFTQWSRSMIAGDGPITGAITRAVIDPATGTYRAEHYDDRGAEFSRIDDRLTGQEHRHFITTTRTDAVPAGEKNLLQQIDTVTGAIARWDSGDHVFEEVCFLPGPGSEPGNGFYATFRTDRTTLESDFVLVSADDVAAGPVARIPLPHRVPCGLHGNWFPAD
ncbi:MAG: carotenoid oxygenase family protein [Aquihabitans sp.]